jgi:anti-sigma factor RsiW
MLNLVLHRRACPSSEHLALYQLNLLPAEERLVTAKHVRECPHCTAELDDLARTGEGESLLERLRSAIDTIKATKIPASHPEAMPVRGAASMPLCFRTEALDVLLTLQPGQDLGHRTISGRLLPRGEIAEPPAQQETWLLGQEESWAAPIEGRGTFVFEDVEPGTYSLGLQWEGQVILMEGVSVQ